MKSNCYCCYSSCCVNTGCTCPSAKVGLSLKLKRLLVIYIPKLIFIFFIRSNIILFFLIIGEPKCFFTGYDFALFLLIPSTIIFLIVLRAEYLRLDQVQ